MGYKRLAEQIDQVELIDQGLDYISQEDLFPYVISDAFSRPIHHKLFDRFLYPEPGRVPPFAPREALQSWQEKNHKWLELTDVHRETTSNIRITVMPFHMGTKVRIQVYSKFQSIIGCMLSLIIIKTH